MILGGYEEIPHTADWALHVWAPDLETLFVMAARGMYDLMELQIEPQPRTIRNLDLTANDVESLLVLFLSELLYLSEHDSLGFNDFDLNVASLRLSGSIQGSRICRQRKEIKAVTYHNLTILPIPNGLDTTIVFDV